MGRKSTKANKTIYQLYREERGLTREKASELMGTLSSDRIEKIENERIDPLPYDILQMSKCYKAPNLCNYYCSHQCDIGKKYIPEIEITELPNIIIETIASLNSITPLTNRLIEISRDGKITDDEIPDFAQIKSCLDQVSQASDALNLWVERTISQEELNEDLLREEIEKLK